MLLKFSSLMLGLGFVAVILEELSDFNLSKSAEGPYRRSEDTIRSGIFTAIASGKMQGKCQGLLDSTRDPLGTGSFSGSITHPCHPQIQPCRFLSMPVADEPRV